jgi:hypothetical protein
MTFVYFTDDEDSQIGVPLKSITEIKFDKDADGDSDSDELRVEVKEGEYYEITGKAARKAWEEIRIQIMATDKNRDTGINR